MILAIDPGPAQSAFVILAGRRPAHFGKLPNAELLSVIDRHRADAGTEMVIEMIASYGRPVGAETFRTCTFIGRLQERWGRPSHEMTRVEVKQALCHGANANDAVIRQRLIDLYGPSKERAIGTKAAPGLLYGLKADMWQALALAIAFDMCRSAKTA